MIRYLQRRKLRKMAQHTLRHARHVRNMQEDIMKESELAAIREHEERVQTALRGGEGDALHAACDAMHEVLATVRPARSAPVVREYVELIAVALAVAMGFRAYFIQPFKIPTGSMQPTLYGITSWKQAERGFMDHWPLKLVKWAVTGQWYREVVVKAPGHRGPKRRGGPYNQSDYFYEIAGKKYKVPRDAVDRRGELAFREGDYVPKGTVLWAGIVKAGDHVFVDKVRWNFLPPRRGQVSVFSTENIPFDPPLAEDTHYIKRMVGLPGETISIAYPNLLVDGEKVLEPIGIARVTSCRNQYKGYRREAGFTSIRLAPGQYFALGDNTTNSRDGRFWGHVPEENLVGPAALLYWPFFRDGRCQAGLIR